MVPASAVGGMEVALRHSEPGKGLGHRAFQVPSGRVQTIGSSSSVTWTGPDDQLAEVVDEVVSTMRGAMTTDLLPSSTLQTVHGLLRQLALKHGHAYRCAVILAHFQFDACGAWVTLAGAGNQDPSFSVTRGWVDMRGHGPGPLGGTAEVLSNERVGLGPGDSLVLCSDSVVGSRNVDGTVFGDKVLPDALIDAAGRSAEAVGDMVLAEAARFSAGPLQGDGIVLVLRVPETVRNDGVSWAASSTGKSADQLALQRSPLQEGRTDLWSQPVIPPREALVRLRPEPPSIPALRRLLRRLLLSWRLSVSSGGDIELLATEMATHAFSVTASPVTVVVRYTGSHVRVEVGDGERKTPRKRRQFQDMHGHRLALVESLAFDWGVRLPRRAHGCGLRWPRGSSDGSASGELCRLIRVPSEPRNTPVERRSPGRRLRQHHLASETLRRAP